MKVIDDQVFSENTNDDIVALTKKTTNSFLTGAKMADLLKIIVKQTSTDFKLGSMKKMNSLAARRKNWTLITEALGKLDIEFEEVEDVVQGDVDILSYVLALLHDRFHHHTPDMSDGKTGGLLSRIRKKNMSPTRKNETIKTITSFLEMIIMEYFTLTDPRADAGLFINNFFNEKLNEHTEYMCGLLDKIIQKSSCLCNMLINSETNAIVKILDIFSNDIDSTNGLVVEKTLHLLCYLTSHLARVSRCQEALFKRFLEDESQMQLLRIISVMNGRVSDVTDQTLDQESLDRLVSDATVILSLSFKDNYLPLVSDFIYHIYSEKIKWIETIHTIVPALLTDGVVFENFYQQSAFYYVLTNCLDILQESDISLTEPVILLLSDILIYTNKEISDDPIIADSIIGIESVALGEDPLDIRISAVACLFTLLRDSFICHEVLKALVHLTVEVGTILAEHKNQDNQVLDDLDNLRNACLGGFIDYLTEDSNGHVDILAESLIKQYKAIGLENTLMNNLDVELWVCIARNNSLLINTCIMSIDWLGQVCLYNPTRSRDVTEPLLIIINRLYSKEDSVKNWLKNLIKMSLSVLVSPAMETDNPLVVTLVDLISKLLTLENSNARELSITLVLELCRACQCDDKQLHPHLMALVTKNDLFPLLNCPGWSQEPITSNESQFDTNSDVNSPTIHEDISKVKSEKYQEKYNILQTSPEKYQEKDNILQTSPEKDNALQTLEKNVLIKSPKKIKKSPRWMRNNKDLKEDDNSTNLKENQLTMNSTEESLETQNNVLEISLEEKDECSRIAQSFDGALRVLSNICYQNAQEMKAISVVRLLADIQYNDLIIPKELLKCLSRSGCFVSTSGEAVLDIFVDIVCVFSFVNIKEPIPIQGYGITVPLPNTSKGKSFLAFLQSVFTKFSNIDEVKLCVDASIKEILMKHISTIEELNESFSDRPFQTSTSTHELSQFCMINRTMLEDSLNFIPPCSGRSFSSPHCEIFEVTPSLVRSDSRFSLASKVPSLTSKSGKTYNEARKQRAAYKIKTVENREDEGRRQRLPQIVGKDNARSASVGASPRNADPAKAEYMKDRLKRAMTSPEVTNVVHVYSRGLTKLFDSFASESNQMKLRDFMKLVSGCGLPGKGTYVKVLFSKCGAPIMTPEDLHTALAHLSVYHLDVDPMKMTDSLVSCALIKLFDHMHLNDPGKALTQWLHKMHTINETLPRYIGVGFEDLCNVKIKCKTKGKLSKPLSDDIAELEKLAFRYVTILQTKTRVADH
eukprot:GHVL01015572.1.p1 GENE.GHVL01015572.1~~GHVL01015572.1.p1  ORF type:complete len:1265 (-),score=208.33 GHVL01015572.1:226-4020(-)